MDLVGNASSLILGAAVGVALIPGAQPMLVVGGVLSVASLVYKFYRNREKVWKNVKKKYK